MESIWGVRPDRRVAVLAKEGLTAIMDFHSGGSWARYRQTAPVERAPEAEGLLA